MGNLNFYDWLVNEKKMTHYAAKDVISRCNRVIKILGADSLNDGALTMLSSKEEFSGYSKFVKSQLKRAVKLYEEFQGAK